MQSFMLSSKRNDSGEESILAIPLKKDKKIYTWLAFLNVSRPSMHCPLTSHFIDSVFALHDPVATLLLQVTQPVVARQKVTCLITVICEIKQPRRHYHQCCDDQRSYKKLENNIQEFFGGNTTFQEHFC